MWQRDGVVFPLPRRSPRNSKSAERETRGFNKHMTRASRKTVRKLGAVRVMKGPRITLRMRMFAMQVKKLMW